MKVLPRPALGLLCAAALCLPAAPLEAQAAYAGQVIQEIRFEGLVTLTDSTLLYYLEIEPGDRLDLEELNEALHRLWSRRLIDDFTVEAEEVEGGIRLVISVVERPLLVSIEYQGLKRLDRIDINDRIASEGIQVREGDPLDKGELHRLKAAIEEMYLEKGFRFSEARYTIETVSPAERRVTFTIDEGDRVRIAEISFEGNTVFSDRRLRHAMEETKETGIIARIRKKDVYNAANLEQDLDLVREVYRKAGYKNVVLGEPKLEVEARRPDAPTIQEQKRRLVLTIPVEEGQRWRLGEIEIQGAEQFSSEMLLRLFKEPRGGWLRQNVIDEGVEAVRDIYSNTGYIFAQVGTEIVERDEEAAVADVVVKVDEGDQFRIGRIEFQGNTRTRDKVLRRQMAVQEGFVLNSGALRNSLLRIRQLEFFVLDEEDPVEFDFDAEEKTVDLLVKGEEGDRTEFQFGAGFSEIDGFFGTVSFRTRNFLGRGETAAANIQVGRFRNIFEISYFIPWFLDRPQTVGIDLFSRDLDFDLLTGQTFFQKSQGVNLTYGRTLSLFTSVSFNYTRFDAEDRRTAFNLDGTLVEQQFERDVSSLRVAYGFNRVDSRINPTNGYRYNGSVEYAGGPLGGTTSYVRALAGYSLFLPVSKQGLRTVAGFNVDVGYIEPFGGDELIFNDRFFTGGENSVRGFRFRSIWVRDEDGRTVTDELGFPLGGNKLININLEYHFLLAEPFRILFFADAGNVYSEDQSFDLERMRYSAGIELRVTVPVFGQPLRFIYSQNLDPIEEDEFGADRFETFQFSLGSSF